MTENETLCRAYFDQVEELKDAEGNSAGSLWQCREGPVGKGVVKRMKAGGWSALAAHARNLAGKAQLDRIVTRKVSADAWNVHHWIDPIVIGDHPLSFVETLPNK